MTSLGKTWEGKTHRHERRGGIAAPPLPGLSPLFTGEENEARSGLGGYTLPLPLQTGRFPQAAWKAEAAVRGDFQIM